MLPKHHVIASGILAAGIYYVQREPLPTLACFAAGWLIDIDHFYDYFRQCGVNTSFSKIYNAHNDGDVPGFHAYLHGWEYMFLFLAAYLFAGHSNIVAGTAAGYALHLAMDEVGNKKSTMFTYFITYRLINGFDKNYFLTQR